MSTAIPFASGARDGSHLEEFYATPIEFLHRVYQECGEVGEFDMGGLRTVLMVGPEAQEAFFRAPEKQLSAAGAYQMMIPVFGEGVQYGAEPHIERQQLRIQYQGLKHDKMVNYAAVVAQEVKDFIADWGDEGELDIVEAFTDLTLKTSTHCLLGSDFRYTLTEEFADLYRDLENGIDPSALLDPNQHKENFTKRDIARARLEELISERVAQRRASGEFEHDLLQLYIDSEYEDGSKLSDHEITGMVIWFMFAGHHTSSNTSAWTLLEITRHPEYLAAVHEEVDRLLEDGVELSLTALRELPLIEGFMRECLRVHPPLNAISRRVMYDFEYKGHVIEAGKNVMVCPHIAHKLASHFPNPEKFDPYREPPENRFADISFGGGRRRCVGNAFAALQVKTIISALLQEYDFSLTQAAEDYTEIMPALILRPSDPCKLHYKRRDKASAKAA